MTRCGACRGRGHRVIATISGSHWTGDANGQATLARSFAIPLIVPCVCAVERVADNEEGAPARPGAPSGTGAPTT